MRSDSAGFAVLYWDSAKRSLDRGFGAAHSRNGIFGVFLFAFCTMCAVRSAGDDHVGPDASVTPRIGNFIIVANQDVGEN